MSDDEATANNESRPAVGAPVQPSVRPRAWADDKVMTGRIGAWQKRPRHAAMLDLWPNVELTGRP